MAHHLGGSDLLPDWKLIAQFIQVYKDLGVGADVDGQDIDEYIVQLLSSPIVLQSCLSEPSNIVASILSLCDSRIDLVLVVQTVVERCAAGLLLRVQMDIGREVLDGYIATRSLQDSEWELHHTHRIFQCLATELTPLIAQIAVDTVNTVVQHTAKLHHSSSIRSQVRAYMCVNYSVIECCALFASDMWRYARRQQVQW